MLGGRESAEQCITLNAGKSGRVEHCGAGHHPAGSPGRSRRHARLPCKAGSILCAARCAAGKAKAETAPDEDGDEADTRAALGGSYELREYRDWDTIKQVHWKLSAKLDRLMVREPRPPCALPDPRWGPGRSARNGAIPQHAAKHRKNPPKRKKERTALSRAALPTPAVG